MTGRRCVVGREGGSGRPHAPDAADDSGNFEGTEYGAAMAIDMAQFHEMFFAESEELLSHAHGLLSNAGRRTAGADDVAELYRCLHSIRGGSHTFGFEDMAALAGVCEALLEQVRDREAQLDDAIVEPVLAAIAALRRQLSACRSGTLAGGDVASARSRRLMPRAAEEGAPTAAGAPIETLRGVAVLELCFVVSRAVCSDILLDDMLEKLGELGELVTVDRPPSGRHDDEWTIEIVTGHADAPLRAVLDRVVEPGTLRIKPCDGEAGERSPHDVRHGDRAVRQAVGDDPGAITWRDAIRLAAGRVARGRADMAVHVGAQAVAFEELLWVVERRHAHRETRGGQDDMMATLRRFEQTVRQGERLTEQLGLAWLALQQLLDEQGEDVQPPRDGNVAFDPPRSDEQSLRSHRRTARISPSRAAHHRLGAPLPKIRRGVAAASSAMEDDWEMLGT